MLIRNWILLFAIAARNPKTMQIVYSYKELMQAVKKNKLACLSGVEGGHMIEDNLDYLDSFYKRGVRYMTLSWNNSTSWSTSAMDESQQSFKVTSYGLNDFGKQVVRKMNRLGMMVDVSHIGEKTFSGCDVNHNQTCYCFSQFGICALSGFPKSERRSDQGDCKKRRCDTGEFLFRISGFNLSAKKMDSFIEATSERI